MTLEQLTAIEEIRRLKARYFRLMDTKCWDEWAEVFAADARLRWGPGASEVAQGRETIVKLVSGILRDAVTCHHGTLPEIDLIDADHATGVWAMSDLVDHPDFLLHGLGHYHDEYVRRDGTWRIQTTHLTRLREDRRPKGDARA